jgi:D-Tyr-tRNAtyr deacylase
LARAEDRLAAHLRRRGRRDEPFGVDVGGGILAVSQFTLYASTKKGARPSWSGAAPPEEARPQFAAFVEALARASGKPSRPASSAR